MAVWVEAGAGAGEAVEAGAAAQAAGLDRAGSARVWMWGGLRPHAGAAVCEAPTSSSMQESAHALAVPQQQRNPALLR